MPVDSTQATPIWLAHVVRTVETTSSVIGPLVVWNAAVSVAMAFIHASHGGNKRKKETQGGWCWWSLYQSLTYLCTLALKLYFPSQRGMYTKTTWQCSFFIFRLNWTPFTLSFSAAADYDVHSLLSAWLRLASNQRPALHCCSPCTHSQTTANHCFFILDSGLLPLVCCLMSCWLWTNTTWPVILECVRQHNSYWRTENLD